MNGNTVIRASQVFAEVSASLKMDKMESARVPSLNVGSETPSWRIQLSHSFVLGFVPTKQIEKQKLEKINDPTQTIDSSAVRENPSDSGLTLNYMRIRVSL